ncbi:MAG: YciI family protein [Actinomycetota bacterium]|nr:YciI family protein [Actinomycetota bacterium]
MKYLLMIYANQDTWASLSPDDWTAAIAEQDAFNAKFFATGEPLGAYGLADMENAKVVRVRDGAPAITDGPYLESKEYLASYYLLDVEHEQRALDIAAEMPFAAFRAVEVWPVLHEAATEI